MYLQRSESGWKALAPAKLNLYLDVIGRRSDGFHELETVMVPVRLFDSLALWPTPAGDQPGAIRLRVRDATTGPRMTRQSLATNAGDNLVSRALVLLQKASGCPQGARVRLVKRIPIGAGLGGGSSDAAAALVLANRAWQLNWNLERLAELAAQVGSDVPFFLNLGPAVCRGRGERIESLDSFPKLHFVVACPNESLSTEAVYRSLVSILPRPPKTAGLAELVHCLHRGAVGSIGPMLWNGLQATATQLLPAIDCLKDAFGQLGFVGHQLTGSGSAYFGVCRSARHAARLAALLRARMPIWAYPTCTSR